MRGLPSILPFFCDEFNKFNNTRARMLNSILSNDINNNLKCNFGIKTVFFVIIIATFVLTS